MTRGGNTRKTGARYELLAAVHLEKCGYHIIEKNYRCRIGEIDLVACDRGVSGICGGQIPQKQQEGRCGRPPYPQQSRKRSAAWQIII